MYNKVFKNYQINVGSPFQIKQPVNIKIVPDEEDIEQNINDNNDAVYEESPEDILAKAREEAEIIIREAHYEAERIISNTETEIDQIKAKVEKESREKGFDEGYEEGRKQYEQLINEAEAIKEQAGAEYAEVLAGIESDAVNLVLDIVKKVIGDEVSTNKENILYLIKQAFQKCTSKNNAVLKLAIDDYDYVSANKDKLLSMVEGLSDVELKKEPSMKSGDCIIETPFGDVNAGVQTKLEKIENAFMNVIGE